MASPTHSGTGAASGPTGAVAIGGSAGAVEWLLAVLPTLPQSFPHPILAVIHLPPDRPSLLPEIFAPRCALRICEAEDKQPLEAGTIYFAPSGYHMLVEEGPALALSVDTEVHFCRPSIDVLFESAAHVFGPRLLGILLSGANADGARGLQAVADSGGAAWVQPPESARATAMPRAALAACPSAQVHSLEQMIGLLGSWQPPNRV